MQKSMAFELPPLKLEVTGESSPLGTRVLAGILRMAEEAIQSLTQVAGSGPSHRVAAVGRLRGTGRGVHFGELIAALEAHHPIQLEAPFEDSHLVAGAAWDAARIVGNGCHGALAKLRWSAGADDLPMHEHLHSDRFIIVHEGRGYFHVTDQDVDGFDGTAVRSIPARERDVFLFTRGTVHTFSTAGEAMTLLSCQLPYLAFDDPRQYRLPRHRWIARDNPEPSRAAVGCDPAWTVLAMAGETS